MSNHRRAAVPGATCVFPVNLADRRRMLADSIDAWRAAHAATRLDHPDAMAVLPDHLHAVWRPPKGDADFPARWRKLGALQPGGGRNLSPKREQDPQGRARPLAEAVRASPRMRAAPARIAADAGSGAAGRRTPYLAAVIASRHDPKREVFRKRPQDAGKPARLALTACAGKRLAMLRGGAGHQTAGV